MNCGFFNRRIVTHFIYFFLAIYSLQYTAEASLFEIPSPWVWVCNSTAVNKCIRTPSSDTVRGTSESVCKLTCYDSSILWPKPTGATTLSKNIVPFVAAAVKVTKINANTIQTENMLKEAAGIFTEIVQQMENNGLNGQERTCSVKANTCGTSPYAAADQQFNIEVTITSDAVQLVTDMDESYTLAVKTKSSVTSVYIVATTFFGARHAMETLSQLIVWDDLANSLVVMADADIQDAPTFTHRGLSLDTSRSYVDIPILHRVIQAMSYNKMNVLHWHILDSHSFPFVSTREPLMAIYGAYSARKVYRPQDIQQLVQYAAVRGVKIIPELDQPSHVGSGWEWGPKYGLGDLTLCFDIQPWDIYCAEPPCGILNPINENVYTVLNNIYKDMSELFQSDIFHMGGDEVNMRCWNETQSIIDWMNAQGYPDRQLDSFIKFWSNFQNRSLVELDKAYGKKQDVILWTSDLTYNGNAARYLDPSRYIIQFWDDWNDPNTKQLYEQGYRLIMSNADVLYLDCGYGSWVGNGLNNWCSPYKGWKIIYENSPRKIVGNFSLPYNAKQFLGGEAALWTENTEGWHIEGKLWPRGSALAERLWTDPTTGWYEAEPRMNFHRQRMVDRGIMADLLQPQWCSQNDGSCYLP